MWIVYTPRRGEPPALPESYARVTWPRDAAQGWYGPARWQPLSPSQVEALLRAAPDARAALVQTLIALLQARSGQVLAVRSGTETSGHRVPRGPIAAAGQDPETFLERHFQGDWGEVPEADRWANERALTEGRALRSVYSTASGRTLWVLTKADRSWTTLLLAEDY